MNDYMDALSDYIVARMEYEKSCEGEGYGAASAGERLVKMSEALERELKKLLLAAADGKMALLSVL